MSADINETFSESQRYIAISQVSNDVIWDWDMVTNTIWWNNGHSNIYGIEQSNHPLDKLLQHIHEEDLPKVMSSIKRVVEKGEARWSAEFRFKKADGTYAYVLDRGYTVKNNGKVVRMIGSMLDISEQKLLQTAKEESEEWMQFALDSAELGIWYYDVATGATKIDNRCKALLGAEGVNTSSYMEVMARVHPDDFNKISAAIAVATNPLQRGNFSVEFRVRNTENEEERWIRTKGKAYFNADNSVKRISGIIQDISREIKDKHEQEMLLRLVENSPEFMALGSPDGRVIYLNSAAKKLVGIDENVDVQQMYVKDFYKPEHYEFLEKEILPALYENGSWSGKNNLRHFITGESIPCHVEYITVNDPVSRHVLARGVTVRDLRADYAAQSEQLKLLTLVDNSVDLMSILRMDGTNSYINKAGRELLGLDEDVDVTQIPITNFHTEEQLAFVEKEILPNVLGKGRWSGRFAIRNMKTGEIIPLENNSLRIDDLVTGEPIGVGAVMRDLRPELEAQKEQRKLLFLLENSRDFVSLSDVDGNVSYVNAAGLKMLGLDKLDDAKRHNSEFLMPDEVPRLKQLINTSLIEKGSWTGEVLYKHFITGEAIPVYGTSMLVYDAITKVPQGRATIVRDLRPERAAQKALQDSEALFRSIATAMPLILWTADEKGTITFINQKWTEFLGIPEQEFDAGIWINATLEDDLKGMEQAYMDALTNQKAYIQEYRMKRSDGAIIWVQSVGQPQYNEAGSFNGLLGYTIDVTQQKELQRQKDEFLGIASHELKTPVTSIKAYTQILENTFRKKGELQEARMLERMDIQINKLTSLINDLLDVTKIQAGKLQFNEHLFEFNSMADDVVEELQRTTEKHAIIKKFDTIGQVFGDEHRLAQVITNFITNAIKYSPNANEIIVTTKKQNNQVVLSVQDFGIGIPANKRERVFEQFYRVTDDKLHTFPGIGLGLYISAEIIKREHGKIWVESEVGSGTTFYFSIPIDHRVTQ